MRQNILYVYLLVINMLTFFVWGWDKRQARVDQRNRIPENKLLRLVVAGGGIGAIGWMSFFRHKTIKGSFAWKVYVLILLWVVAIVVGNNLL